MKERITVIFFRKLPTTGLYDSIKTMGDQMGRISHVGLKNSLARMEDSKYDYAMKAIDEHNKVRNSNLYKKIFTNLSS